MKPAEPSGPSCRLDVEPVEDAVVRPCTIVLHDDRVSTCEVLSGVGVVHVGDLAYLSADGARTLLIVPSGRAVGEDEISLHITIAERYGFGNRTSGAIQPVRDVDAATATHVEFLFRDQHLTRADMWQLMGCLTRTVIYRGQTVNYLGTGTAEVMHIYHAGNEVESAYISHPQTKPIFRSASSRFTLLIEVSREMFENWSNGDLMYERMINGYLDELFSRWQALKVKHSVSVVLFGRVPATHAAEQNYSHDQSSHTDFFQVLTSEASSDSWLDILRKLCKVFGDNTLPRSLCLAAESNMLEAINLAAMDFADERTDMHLPTTGQSIIAITAGTGLFEADYTLLKHTTDLLVGNSIGVDIVALSAKPLHPAPLFRYNNRGSIEYALPHWVDISFWKSANDFCDSSWKLGDSYGPLEDIALPILPASDTDEDMASMIQAHDRDTFRRRIPQHLRPSTPETGLRQKDLGTSIDTVRDVKIEPQRPKLEKKHMDSFRPPASARSRSSSTLSSPVSATKDSHPKVKRDGAGPLSLLQTGRKISLGPRGLALTRSAASTALSTTTASQEKEVGGTTALAGHESSGIAKQIRASLARKQSSVSLATRRLSSDTSQTSRPIDILTGQESSPIDPQDPATAVERGMVKTTLEATLEQDSPSEATLKVGNMLPADSGPLSDALDMLSPWVMLKNPCNPRRDNMRIASQYRKWQHVFPRAISSGAFKWSSMCSPAALPLTAEYRPTVSELEKHYEKTFRRHIVSDSFGENARELLERLIDARLVQGFQIVSIANSGSERTYQSQDRPIMLALGRIYHELQRLSDSELQIVQYEPVREVENCEFPEEPTVPLYRPIMRMSTGNRTTPTIAHSQQVHVNDWADIDEHILGFDGLSETSAAFKLRLVLIPVEIPRQDYESSARSRELSDDERRIEGIRRLTQVWQRQRHLTIQDQQHQASLSKLNKKISAERDPNPLAIEYHTRDPSALVNAYGPMLSNHLIQHEIPVPLFAESEKHHSDKFDVYKLVKQMQESPPRGVEMRDRRWLAVNHIKCFRGDEMTTWLLGAFKDLKLRDDAVAVGEELLTRGFFTHVRQKHNFRDGHYFYQINAQYRTTDYPDSMNLFSKVPTPWRSIPTTPLNDSVTSPMSRPTFSIPSDYASTNSSRSTPVIGPTGATGAGAEKDPLLLSQSLKYNVDPSKKSDHSQVIDLHYDRIHNPDNCYHISLEWLGASTKLVQAAVSRWATLVEPHGLKLMQVPLAEVSRWNEHHPFDQPIPVKLAMRPPERGLATPLIEPQSASPKMIENHFAYHKALLRQNDFVLDYEAASAFSAKLHVRYSFGPLRYAYTQFIHRSGVVLAQIVSDDENVDFLLLPNRSASRRPAQTALGSKHESIVVDSVEAIIEKFRNFCADGNALSRVYQDARESRRRASHLMMQSPYLKNDGGMDGDIPPMSLPPHLGHRANLKYL